MTINKFLINKGVKSNAEKITILQMVRWVDEWQEQEQLNTLTVSNSLSLDKAKALLRYDYTKLLNGDWVLTEKQSKNVLRNDISKENLIDYVLNCH